MVLLNKTAVDIVAGITLVRDDRETSESVTVRQPLRLATGSATVLAVLPNFLGENVSNVLKIRAD